MAKTAKEMFTDTYNYCRHLATDLPCKKCIMKLIKGYATQALEEQKRRHVALAKAHRDILVGAEIADAIECDKEKV